MYGWKARIGLMVPSTNIVIEPEFNAMVSEGISVHSMRLLSGAGTIEDLKKMAEETERAAILLATARVNIIVYGCTSGSMLEGVGYDQKLIDRIEKTTGIQATTTSTAVIRAFRELGIGKVAVATPYTEKVNQIEKEFFEAHGVKVVNIKGLNIHGEERRRLAPETTYELACEVDSPEADAVFISCTNFKSITIIEKLEEKLHKYVFSSNTATMWDILKRLATSGQIKGYGKLFEH